MAVVRYIIFALIVVTHGFFVDTASEKHHPLSDEFINVINSKQNTWRAGRNFHPGTPLSYIKGLTGAAVPEMSAFRPIARHDDEIIAKLPEHFDAREKWPNCPSMNEIRNQGACGSCWIFGPVEAMTDRYCTFSNGTKQFHFSAQDVLSCSGSKGDCRSGSVTFTYDFWLTKGIVSGGNYDSKNISEMGCRPYVIPPQVGHEETLLRSSEAPIAGCIECCQSSYTVDYKKDKRYGKSVNMLPNDEEQIKAELFMNGPIAAQFWVYSDFLHYKKGVYKKTHGEIVGGHVLKILGWGVEDGTKYWLMANSWGPVWGDKGFLKFLRGENHCNIEDRVYAAVPIIE